MRDLRRIDVLLNKNTGERFNEEDIVKITKIGIYNDREYIGRIDSISTLEMVLDMSKEYNFYTIKIEYKDIETIEKVK